MKYYGYETTDLIPELPEWKALNGEDFDIEGWLNFHISPELIIAVSTLFYPEFEECNGGVFFKNTSVVLAEAKGNQDLDIIDLQKLYNHRHLVDFFVSDTKFTRTQLECIGKILVDVWKLKLNAQFPHLNNCVELYGLDSDDDSDLIIFVWAEKPPIN